MAHCCSRPRIELFATDSRPPTLDLGTRHDHVSAAWRRHRGTSRCREPHDRARPPASASISCRRAPIGCRSIAAFTLHDATAIVPYLQTLGIGAAYTSPYFAAQPGSTHGYDVSNHNELNVELGGERGPHRVHRRAARARPAAHRGLRAESHGDRRPAPTRGGGMCSRTGRARRRPVLRHRLGAGEGGAQAQAAAADPRRSVRPRARARRIAARVPGRAARS